MWDIRILLQVVSVVSLEKMHNSKHLARTLEILSIQFHLVVVKGHPNVCRFLATYFTSVLGFKIALEEHQFVNGSHEGGWFWSAIWRFGQARPGQF